MKKKKISMYKGLPLVDATEDMEITVTKHDVSSARKNDPNKCAAANAIKRESKSEAEVHIARTYVKKNNTYIRFVTPTAIAREITSFDRAAAFEPGEYVLKAPHKGMRLGTYRGTSTAKTGKKRKHHVTVNIRESARLTK